MTEKQPEYGSEVVGGIAKTISKQQRKIDQLNKTVEQLHERLAAVQSSKRNKASQIARLNSYLDRWHICKLCGEALEASRSLDENDDLIYYECECRDSS